MGERGARYHTKPHLRVVKPDGEVGSEAADPAGSDGRRPDAPTEMGALAQARLDASGVLGNAVMYAAMSWVACCMEQTGESVSVMPLGEGLFDAEVRFYEGPSIWLRVRLTLESGPVLSTRVEPIHP